MKKKIIRITTVPQSLGGLLKGQLKFMSQYYEIIGISSDGNGTLAHVGEQEGISVIPVEMTRKITPLADLKAVYQLYKIFKKEKPAIVHTHTPKAGTLGMFAAFLARVPHRFHTIAGLPLLEAKGSKRKVLDTVEKFTYACATMIYPNSFGLNDIIISNGYTSAKKLKVLGNGSSNGIDTTIFDPDLFNEQSKKELKLQWGIQPDDFVFIFLGRLVRDKGIEELISAFKNLSKESPKLKLLLVGTYEKELDPLQLETETEIKTNTNIIFTDWQKDVRPFFSISNVLAFPSYREGFPNVVLQAAAMGIPSIVTNINGCNEIITSGNNGVLVPPKDTKALQNAMDYVYKSNVNSPFNTPKAIRNEIKSKYSNTTVWSNLLTEYRSKETV